jgi:FixJ family two-component response regulator
LRDRQQLLAVVDDDESVRRALGRLLRTAGYAVALFEGGAEFLRSPGTPDCLLLDLDMPGINGADVLEHLERRGLAIPTLIITGCMKVGGELQAGPGRTFPVFRKPFDDQALLDAVAAAIHCAASADNRS